MRPSHRAADPIRAGRSMPVALVAPQRRKIGAFALIKLNVYD
jgi:hypothetical protein